MHRHESMKAVLYQAKHPLIPCGWSKRPLTNRYIICWSDWPREGVKQIHPLILFTPYISEEGRGGANRPTRWSLLLPFGLHWWSSHQIYETWQYLRSYDDPFHISLIGLCLCHNKAASICKTWSRLQSSTFCGSDLGVGREKGLSWQTVDNAGNKDLFGCSQWSWLRKDPFFG